MQVTVIMGVYNPPVKEELDIAIESILRQSLQIFEFLIVDDGSDYDKKQWLLEYAKKDPRIRVIQKEENKGLASALNTCIAQAKGKYIARMDGDDYSEVKRLEIQYHFLENHPEYAFVGSNAKLIDREGIWGSRRMPEKPEKIDFLPYSPFIHPSVMVRKDVYEACGGYREGKETWRSEDYEIFMRMYVLGYRGYNMQQYLFRYRETRNSYCKRKYQYRMDEAKIRYRYFKELQVPFFLRSIYVMKPLLVGLFPVTFVTYIKAVKGHKELYQENNRYGKQKELPKYTNGESTINGYSQ